MLFLVSLSLVFTSTLVASEAYKYLSDEKKEILNIEKEVNTKQATNLKLDWINPIVASYSYSKSDQIGAFSTSKFFRISFDQPIFKSGGIYFAIKYSDANKKFKEIAQSTKESNLIKSLYDSVLNLKKLDAQIQKATLSILNAKIDIQRKKEQFDSGLLDSSFLDSAILNKTKLEHQRLSLEASKFALQKSFENLSDYDYKEVNLPHFESVSQEVFIKNNIEISSSHSNKNQAKELKNMTISNYLPTFSLYGDYSHKDDEVQFFKQAKEYKTYGVRVSMPIFAINRGRDIEIRKLEYLKAKIALKDSKKASIHEFQTIENTISILKKRVEIAKSDLLLYNSLVKNAQDGLAAGEKTILDVDTLKNSKEIASLDEKIYNIDIELELLKLYAKMSDAI